MTVSFAIAGVQENETHTSSENGDLASEGCYYPLRAIVNGLLNASQTLISIRVLNCTVEDV